MPSAPLPLPQYIGIDNIQGLIGEDKILISDTEPNAIKIADANVLIANGEAIVVQDLSPYYHTNPTLLTINNEPWTSLPPNTYNQLYQAFVYMAMHELLSNYIERNSKDRNNGELWTFKEEYNTKYTRWLQRILDSVKIGAFRYKLDGLKPLFDGINRTPNRYSSSGRLGKRDYVDHQLTNPQRNFFGYWGRRVTYREK